MEKFNLLMPFQKDIIPYVIAGFSNPEIAILLHYSVATIKSEMSEIFKITNTENRVQLAVKADRSDIFKRLSDYDVKNLKEIIKKELALF